MNTNNNDHDPNTTSSYKSIKQVILTQSPTNCNLTVPADADKDEYIGKIPRDEILLAIEPPVRVGNFRRVKVRRTRDEIEGYVTMRTKEKVEYFELLILFTFTNNFLY